MKEYIVKLILQVDEEVLEQYENVNDLIYSNTDEVPFCFSVEDIHECKEVEYGCKKAKSNDKQTLRNGYRL